MVTNPPYGERISTPDLLGTYRTIGEILKHQFKENDAWVLSYREECFDQIGLKPSIKIPLYNGSLECEFRKYQIFDGKLKDFRSEGNILKTEEEKRAMADKHRFKKTASLRSALKRRMTTRKATSARSNSTRFRSKTAATAAVNAEKAAVSAETLTTIKILATTSARAATSTTTATGADAKAEKAIKTTKANAITVKRFDYET